MELSFLKIIFRFISILSVGMTIKIMDDYLDQDLDRIEEKRTLAQHLQRASLPYALILFSIAVLFNKETAISLFAASYILGMHHEWQENLPFGIKSYQESLLVMIICLIFIRPLPMITSFSLMMLVQIADDFIDYYHPIFPERRNLVRKWGQRASGLLGSILLLFSLIYDPGKTIKVIVATPIIIYLAEIKGWEKECT